MVRRLPECILDLQVDQILLDIHTFLKVHPHQVWKSRADDTPLRTMKTVLHSLAKLKGAQVRIQTFGMTLHKYVITHFSRTFKEAVSLLMLCAPSNLWRPFSYQTKMATFEYSRVLSVLA